MEPSKPLRSTTTSFICVKSALGTGSWTIATSAQRSILHPFFSFRTPLLLIIHSPMRLSTELSTPYELANTFYFNGLP